MILFFILTYAVFGTALQIGWKKIKETNVPVSFQPITSVLLIIPVRNEKEHIGLLLQQIREQDYPEALLSVCIVDDGSTDGSTELIQQCCNMYPKQFYYLTVHPSYAHMKGKKKAIATAIDTSNATLILTTDADCRIYPQWVRTFAYIYETTKAPFISGPVKMIGANTYWGYFQEIEFASLIGSGASAIGLGKPVMCNGANLAYSSEAYRAVKGFEGNEQVASGDDEFLMHKMADFFPGKVTFIKDPQCIVTTNAPDTWNAFVQQRKRWAGKWQHYKMRYVQAIALWVFLFHGLLVISTCLALTGSMHWFWAAALWTTKIGFDYFYLKSIARFLSVGFKIDIFMNSVLIYPVYVVTFGLLSRFGKYDWKERRESIS